MGAVARNVPAVRSTEEEPGYAPAASPRLPRSLTAHTPGNTSATAIRVGKHDLERLLLTFRSVPHVVPVARLLLADQRNVQVLTDPFGRLLWASAALPGSTHDLTAARHHGIIEALTTVGLKCWADKAYQGAGGTIRVPFRGRRLKRWKRRHNTTHAKIRCLGEQAMATLKGWRLLRKLRCSTNRITDVVKAVLVLHLAST
jgi:hypothetical protein